MTRFAHTVLALIGGVVLSLPVGYETYAFTGSWTAVEAAIASVILLCGYLGWRRE